MLASPNNSIFHIIPRRNMVNTNINGDTDKEKDNNDKEGIKDRKGY